MKIRLAACAAFAGALSFALPAFSPPAIAATVDPAAYGHLPAVENIQLSPDGSRYAFIGMLEGKRMLIVATADKRALFMTDLKDLKVRDVRWGGEDHILLMVTTTEDLRTIGAQSYELASVLRINLKDKSFSKIFEGEPSVTQRVFGAYGTATIDGKDVGYFKGLTMVEETGTRSRYVLKAGSKYDLYRVDLDTGKAHIETQGRPDMSNGWLMTPDGKLAATTMYDSKTGTWHLLRAHYDGEVMAKVSPLHQIGLAGFGRTPGTVVVTDTTDGHQSITEVDLATGKKEELFADEDVRSLLHDPQSRLLIGAMLQGHEGARFFDKALEERWRGVRKTFPGVNVTLQSASSNLDHVILRTEGGRDSGTFWLADLATGATTPLGNSYPEIRPPQVGPAKMIQYKAQDGLDIEAVLTLPADGSEKNLPLVVMPHGGPIGISDHVHFDWWAQAFAAAGYAVLQPNYRGSSGYSVAFRDAGYGEWGRKMLTDISDGITALADKGTVDPKRVCIVGASYGGYAALAGVTVQQGLYKCAVAVAGVADVRSLFRWDEERNNHDSEFERYRKALAGKDDNNLDQISPVHFAKRADAPILMIHGKDDTVVPINQSLMMESALKDANKPVEFIRMESEDHWLSRAATRTIMVKESLAFVLKNNPPNQENAAK